MRAAVDLHIHSCLSPCGDEDMTPNNIVNMALLKGLDIIAVTDHNAAGNLPSIIAVAREAGLAVLPGVEACSLEEVHALCYFPSLDGVMAFQEAMYPHLPPLPNTPDVFGRQVLMDDQDEETGVEDKLLIQALDLPLEELVALCQGMGGVVVPAHVNKMANSLLGNLGFVPPGIPFAAMEVVPPPMPEPQADLSSWRHLRSSDAHYLGQILEREFFIEGLTEISAAGMFAWLKEAEAWSSSL